jgi:hypothetical protein
MATAVVISNMAATPLPVISEHWEVASAPRKVVMQAFSSARAPPPRSGSAPAPYAAHAAAVGAADPTVVARAADAIAAVVPDPRAVVPSVVPHAADAIPTVVAHAADAISTIVAHAADAISTVVAAIAIVGWVVAARISRSDNPTSNDHHLSWGVLVAMPVGRIAVPIAISGIGISRGRRSGDQAARQSADC